jgi:hypothetical protein
MNLIDKKKISILLASMALGLSSSASAIPFFSQQARNNTLAQARADTGSESSTRDSLVTGFASDAQHGLSDFQFLARNFSGANAGAGRPPISTTGLIGPSNPSVGPVVPAPVPGSLWLVSLGVALLAWRRRT